MVFKILRFLSGRVGSGGMVFIENFMVFIIFKVLEIERL